MIRGSCLCGRVKFEITRAVGPFELCHCSRCRKASGSAFSATVGVRRDEFHITSGRELIQAYEAPVRETAPGYRTYFCGRCGSPLPNPNPEAAWFEVPAGALDDDPELRPDRHIFVELKSSWFSIVDKLPQLDRAALVKLRSSQAKQCP
jgi:hypothetical protein